MCSSGSCAASSAHCRRSPHVLGFLMLCFIELLCLMLTVGMLYVHTAKPWQPAAFHADCCLCCELTHGAVTAGRVCRPATTFAPLGLVLGVSMIKEALEDVKRWLADRRVMACRLCQL